MNWTDHQRELDEIAAEIAKAAKAAMTYVFAGLAERVTTVTLTRAAFAQYRARFIELFQVAMNARGYRGNVERLLINDVTLSSKLYRNNVEASRVARLLVEAHRATYSDVRKLALELYNGYGKGGQLDAKVELPNYLRKALGPQATEVQRILARIRAGRLRTPALKAAYLEAIEAVEKGRGAEALARKLKTAWEEKQRYYANRIAQTELHRAWSDDQDREHAADDALSVIEIRMSATHPVEDVCDLHARGDFWGLGPGMYPKAEAPKRPFHPFCRCRAVPRYALDADGAKFDPAAQSKFLSTLSDKKSELVRKSASYLLK